VAGLRVDEEQGILAGLVLEPAPVALTPEAQTKQSHPVAAFFMLVGNIVRLWNTSADKTETALRILREKAGATLGEAFPARGPAKFQDVVAPALSAAAGNLTPEVQDELVREHM